MKRVLVVDDDTAIREMAALTLEKSGFSVDRAASAAEARASLSRNRPDLVLCNIYMPGEDGLSVLAEARRLASPPPVILMTARGSVETAAEAARIGAFDYLAKPFDLAHLVERARAAVAAAPVGSHPAIVEVHEAVAEAAGQPAGRAEGASSLEARLRSFRPFPHELAALLYVAAGSLVLELLPVTYPRRAVLLAAWMPAAAIAAAGVAAVAARRAYSRWRSRRRPGERPGESVGTDLLVLLRGGAALVPVLSVHFLLKSFVHLVNPRTWDAALWDADRAAAFGISPSLFLTGLFASPWFLQVLDLVYSRLYFFLIALSVPLLLVLPTLERRMAFLAAYASIWIAGSAFYLAYPSWGPVFVVSSVFSDVLRYMPATVGVQSVLFEELSSLVRDPLAPRQVQFGCVAAFPSLHLAVVTVFAAASRWTSRPWFVGNALAVLVMLIGSVVTGYHYLLDGWAGIALGLAACWLGRRLFPDPVPGAGA